MLTRRQALLLGASATSLFSTLQLNRKAHTPKKDVVIVGGGVAALHANALLQRFSNYFNVSIIAPNREHMMQAGQTFVAVGLMQEAQCKRPLRALIGAATLIAHKALRYEPSQNRILLDDGSSVSYDELIIATGVEADEGAITGLAQQLKQPHICSLYTNDLTHSTMHGAHKTHAWFQAIANRAETKHVDILFVKPAGSIKCGGVTLSLLFMLDDFLKMRKTKHAALRYTITLAKPGNKLFGVEPYNALLLQEAKVRGIKLLFDYRVRAVTSNEAECIHSFKEVVSYDADFDEYHYKRVEQVRSVAFDFMHIVPPMRCEASLYGSALSYAKGKRRGFGKVDVNSLRHADFKNVAIIGDAAGVALGKTVASAQQQAKVVVSNLVANETLSYHGYSACPIKLGFKKALNARFDYSGALQEGAAQATRAMFKKQLHDDVKQYWEDISV